MDSLLFGMFGGIITSILLIGYRITRELKSIESLLKEIVEQKKS